MFNQALETLFDFLSLNPEYVNRAKDILYVRAHPSARLDIFAQKNLVCYQTFKVEADQLRAQGFSVVTEVSGNFDLVIYLGSKQKDENLVNFARALEALKPGGVFLCALPNDLGAGRFEKELGRTGAQIISFSKHHCRVFGLVKESADLPEVAVAWRSLAGFRQIPGTTLLSQPGVFGWAKIDKGSILLAKNLPESLSGHAADLGSGYGYLAEALLTKAPGVGRVELFEAEKLALDASEVSLRPRFPAERLGFHWHDVTAGLPPSVRELDLIVTNPPFHSGKQVNVSLGEKFIEVAAKALRTKGELFLVANQNLPYERRIAKLFSVHSVIDSALGFKVIRAVK